MIRKSALVIGAMFIGLGVAAILQVAVGITTGLLAIPVEQYSQQIVNAVLAVSCLAGYYFAYTFWPGKKSTQSDAAESTGMVPGTSGTDETS